MLNTSSLLRQLASLKVTLSLESNNRIKAVPRERLTDSIRQAIRELKPELTKALQVKKAPPPSHPCPLTNQLESQGLNFSLDTKGQIKAEPSELLTDDIRQMIKDQKTAIVRVLEERKKQLRIRAARITAQPPLSGTPAIFCRKLWSEMSSLPGVLMAYPKL